jgi:hypothetical protein
MSTSTETTQAPKTMGQSRKDRDAKTAKAKADLANTQAPRAGGSGSNMGMRLTLVENAANRYARPPQVQKILNYLEALGGSATVQEIMDLSEVATGGNVWKKNITEPYKQDVATVLEHYHAKLLGEVSWMRSEAKANSKVGTQAYVTIS